MGLKIANVITSQSWGELLPETLERGIGGREGSLIYLSKEWAKLGHEVTCFGNVERGKRYYENEGFHEYVPVSLTNQVLSNWPWDVVIAWECPSVFKEEKIRENVKTKIALLQCADFPTDLEMEYAELFCDYIVPLSEWHKLYLLSRKLNFDEEYIIPFSNGVDLNRYSQKEKLLKKPWRFVYSSSPDRGLLHLLNCWPRIRDLDSEAELVVTYGVKDWIEFLKWSHSKQGEMAVDLEKLMKQNGIVDFGKVGQTQLAKLQMSAVAWPYPLDAIRATETGCISALENMAAGNPIITTDCDCMEMEFSKAAIIIPLPFNEHEFISALDFILSDEQAYATLQQQGYEFVQKRDWSIIAQKWQKFFLSL